MFLFPISSEKDIILKKKVGQGAYGAVYLAEVYDGYPVACKVLSFIFSNKTIDSIN